MLDQLNALSPLDGRYSSSVDELRFYLSESAFMAHRVEVEVSWLIALTDSSISEIQPFSDMERKKLYDLVKNFSLEDAKQIKEIEKITNHDVKAVEYWLKEKISFLTEKEKISEFIHFACTSEDINNTSHALMLSRTRKDILLPLLHTLTNKLENLAQLYSDYPMLARTHGQPASPTTIGKEFANVVIRLKRGIEQIASVLPLAKLNGATGNYNAHIASYPNIDWQDLSRNVLNKLGLVQNTHTTQIEPHDWISQLFDSICRVNNILIDLDRDIWGYISLGYFKQTLKEGEVGSSTMPHKVNPIDFENSEGNLGVANSLLRHMSDKLPISRWQRDLTDSTVLRNIGIALGYCLVAWKSCIRGLNKLEVNTTTVNYDIDNCWEILAEPIQTIMRRYGLPKPYEQLKSLTRGKGITKETLREFIKTLDLPQEVKNSLLLLEPRNYLGISKLLAKNLDISTK
ncbi:adenylosuccinate lyase [Candidatus Kinetoplastibacterium desouzaii TCC079E]|uniref:Adenylosuccinate lyase n=1 Tax=Candidatus Kinetoplastidibacterium desouzai TCC079E TaxID=1208919 RepID=M1LUD4_9PROT|nr:adenylosuccinate lyase [Candidatus Kinetoplastibacterium desouzaii]AGF46914.1 adenylosuccinate lyase [Candidatus Kinetoplastibacterium desouzaii TCC079E]